MTPEAPRTPRRFARCGFLTFFAGGKYTGENRYKLQQAVRGGNIAAANGTAALEFGKEILFALHVMSEDEAEQWYRFYKFGYYEAMKK